MNHVTVDFKQNWTFVLLVQPRSWAQEAQEAQEGKEAKEGKKSQKHEKPKNMRSSSQKEDQVFELFVRSSIWIFGRVSISKYLTIGYWFG